LQYEVLVAGKGPKPKADQTVRVNYRGTFVDGKEFDSSSGTPVELPVSGVIPGWTEALQLMPVGSRWKLFVPAKLGYGSHGAGEKIGPDKTLIFEIELLGIK
jgi:FKBP-type peptidyl-prolyl cis-trans isomerase FklB